MAYLRRLRDGTQHWFALMKPCNAIQTAAAHEQRAQILLQLDRTFDAVQAAQHACRAAPTWGEAELTLARAQLNLGEVFLALQSAERAITLGVENQDAVEEELAEMEHLIVRCSIIDSAATAQSSLGQGKAPAPVRSRPDWPCRRACTWMRRVGRRSKSKAPDVTSKQCMWIYFASDSATLVG